MLCPKCGRKMKNIKHYEKDKSYQFYQCVCTFKTHNKRIHYDECETNQNYIRKTKVKGV